jgi:hypothetical protein
MLSGREMPLEMGDGKSGQACNWFWLLVASEMGQGDIRESITVTVTDRFFLTSFS